MTHAIRDRLSIRCSGLNLLDVGTVSASAPPRRRTSSTPFTDQH